MTEANSCARLSVVGVLPGLTTHPQKLSGAIVSAPKGLVDMRLRRRLDPTAPFAESAVSERRSGVLSEAGDPVTSSESLVLRYPRNPYLSTKVSGFPTQSRSIKD